MTYACSKTGAFFVSAVLLLCTTVPVFASGDQHEKTIAANPNTLSGTCLENTAAYATSTDLQKTASKQYKDVSGTSITFAQGAAGCVEVSFSSEAATVPGEILVTQALLDGQPCSPNENIFASDSPSADLATHAMNYICTGVPAGSHTAKIQFRSRFGGKVALDYRTTIVRYAQ